MNRLVLKDGGKIDCTTTAIGELGITYDIPNGQKGFVYRENISYTQPVPDASQVISMSEQIVTEAMKQNPEFLATKKKQLTEAILRHAKDEAKAKEVVDDYFNSILNPQA